MKAALSSSGAEITAQHVVFSHCVVGLLDQQHGIATLSLDHQAHWHALSFDFGGKAAVGLRQLDLRKKRCGKRTANSKVLHEREGQTQTQLHHGC